MNGRGRLLNAILRFEGCTLQHLRALQAVEFSSAVEVACATEERYAHLVRHAYEQTSYYKRLFDAYDVDPNDATTFHLIPSLSKSHLRQHHERLLSIDAQDRHAFSNASGGSTGQPTRFVQDRAYKGWARAVQMHFDKWTGYAPGSRRALLWGSERDLTVGKENLRRRAISHLRNEIWLNAFKMSPSMMRRHAETISRKRPEHMLAYANSAYELALFIERKRIAVPPMRSIISSAGTLHPHMRETIERVFQAKVFDRYGSREVGGVACECDRHQGLHVSPLTHVVDVIRADGKPCDVGEVGELVVTALHNYSMPLIRYEIGDLAVRATSTCNCGRRWPTLERIVGRTGDVLRTMDGGVVLPEYVIHMLGVSQPAKWATKFQVVQRELDQVEIVLERGEPTTPREMQRDCEAMIQRLRMVLGAGCTITTRVTDSIDVPESGKHRYTISEVAEDLAPGR